MRVTGVCQMNMMPSILALLAFLGFLVVLVVEVPSPDLIAVCGIAAALAIYDLWACSDRMK